MSTDKKLTVGIVSHENPWESRREWSGTIFYARQALEQAGFATEWVSFHKPHWDWYKMCASVALRHGVRGKMGLLPGYGKMCAKTVDRSVTARCDAFLFPSRGEMIQHLHLPQPTLYLTDATLHQMADYYYMGMSPWWRRQTDAVNDATFKAASHIISASQWATDSMLSHYGVAPGKITTVPFGANIDPENVKPASARWQKGETLEILFSGFDWERKGGAIAVAAVGELRKRGIDARLTVVGPKERPAECSPSLPWVDYQGFLYKKDPEQYARYLSIIDRSHLLLLPTKAECAGIVFCEAAGAAIPSFTYDTGGVGDYVINGVTGRRLPLGSTPAQFAEAIIEELPRLESLKDSSREYYLSTLNWSHWASVVGPVIRRLVAEKAAK